MKNYIFLLIPFLFSCQNSVKETKTDSSAFDLPIKDIYDSAGYKGCMLIYDSKNKRYYKFDTIALNQAYSPASTFKICNSLIALETGVAPDENLLLKWDGVKRWIENWNKDQNMREAFKNSTVWYYQEIARRIGKDRMKLWLDSFKYGNCDTSGGEDMFWLIGGMRITPYQQIDFLRKLHERKLPESQHTYSIMRSIMVADSCSDYVLRAKTGTSAADKDIVAWYVGYFETADNVYYFSNTMFHEGEVSDKLFQARKDVVYKVFRRLKIIP